MSGILNSSFEITWKNLSYFIVKKSKKNKDGYTLRQIVCNQNGSFYSFKLTAIMGPSGCGKTTFLKIVMGKINTNMIGTIGISGRQSKMKLKISFVGQNDYLHDSLTVQETMMAASKLKNKNKNEQFHLKNCERICKLMSLENMAKHLVKRCSGGQKRRLSVGLELLNNPDVLIMDEPTTGLDSVTTLQFIEFMKKLTRNELKPVTVIMTIHQPSSNVFQQFDQVYVISRTGQCIYNQSPCKLR